MSLFFLLPFLVSVSFLISLSFIHSSPYSLCFCSSFFLPTSCPDARHDPPKHPLIWHSTELPRRPTQPPEHTKAALRPARRRLLAGAADKAWLGLSALGIINDGNVLCRNYVFHIKWRVFFNRISRSSFRGFIQYASRQHSEWMIPENILFLTELPRH